MTTIHKAQGSEYPIVVMPVLMTHYVMLQRNPVYTGIFVEPMPVLKQVNTPRRARREQLGQLLLLSCRLHVEKGHSYR